MDIKPVVSGTHPQGEPDLALGMLTGRWPLDTPGGRYYAEWDEEISVTREGQLIFFFQFLQTGGRWEAFMKECPLSYSGNRGSGALNVMGTVLLSVLCGHWRYPHINSVRGDRINPSLLKMNAAVSEDAVRAAMGRIKEEEGLSWLSKQLRESIEPVLGLAWILDIDSTVKTLYGHQQGAQLGYNPHKPGRPSHVYHSFFMSGLRICLGVEVMPGKQHAGKHGMPGLWQTLKDLPREKWPCFVRGDCGYGNDMIMEECEQNKLPYLFKLKHSPKVKNLITRLMGKGAGWQDSGDGWEAIESSLKLGTWTRERRVVLVREKPALAPVDENARRRRDHQSLPGAEKWEMRAAPWCGKIAVLVSSLDEETFPTTCMPRLYRERADAENSYDELKNQWGWNGYTTKKLSSCRLMANLIALFYNWWNLYVRLYDEEHHREAITSRPALMQGVAREVRSGGSKSIKVSLMHERSEVIARAVTLVSNELQKIKSITERWNPLEKWTLLLTRILRRWLGGKWLPGLPEDAGPLLSG